MFALVTSNAMKANAGTFVWPHLAKIKHNPMGTHANDFVLQIRLAISRNYSNIVTPV